MQKKEGTGIAPMLLGIFLFVVVGSVLFQVFNITNSGSESII